MKTQKQLAANMASYACSQMVNLLVGLVLPRLYLAVYGSEINGIISTTNSFISYFSYLEAGIGLTLIRSLFKPLAEGNAKKTSEILSYSKRQYRRISVIYFFLVVLLSLTFPFVRKTDVIGQREFAALVFVIGMYGAVDFFTMAKYRVLLTADRREYVISNASIAAQLLRFVLVWTLLQMKICVVFVKVAPIFTILIRSLILKWYIQKRYPEVDYTAAPIQDLAVTNDRWDALLLQVSINTSTALPTIIVAQILGFKEANVYAVYSMVASALTCMVSSLSSGVAPQMGQLLSRGEDINRPYRFYDFMVSLIITIAYSTMSALTIPFVQLYTNVVSDVNYIHPLYAILISMWSALYSYRIPLTAVINAAGIYRENRANNIINLAIQVVLGIIGVLLAGVPGVLISMIIAAVQRNIFFTAINSKVLLHNGVTRSLVHQAVLIIMTSLSGWLAQEILGDFAFSVRSWILTAVVVFVLEAVVCTSIFLVIDSKAIIKNRR